MVAAIVFAWVDWPSDGDWTKAGARGDFWGGHFSPAASLAAALLFVIAILLQYKELKLQREELAATRKEMAAARAVHERQSQALHFQCDLIERQAAASERSAIVSNIIEVIRFRADLEMRQFATEAPKFDVAQSYLASSKPYLEFLLSRIKLDPDERRSLQAAAKIEQPPER